jgi:hypothetical protein
MSNNGSMSSSLLPRGCDSDVHAIANRRCPTPSSPHASSGAAHEAEVNPVDVGRDACAGWTLLAKMLVEEFSDFAKSNRSFGQAVVE